MQLFMITARSTNPLEISKKDFFKIPNKRQNIIPKLPRQLLYKYTKDKF